MPLHLLATKDHRLLVNLIYVINELNVEDPRAPLESPCGDQSGVAAQRDAVGDPGLLLLTLHILHPRSSHDLCPPGAVGCPRLGEAATTGKTLSGFLHYHPVPQATSMDFRSVGHLGDDLYTFSPKQPFDTPGH